VLRAWLLKVTNTLASRLKPRWELTDQEPPELTML
jgi:hypothetical protein